MKTLQSSTGHFNRLLDEHDYEGTTLNDEILHAFQQKYMECIKQVHALCETIRKDGLGKLIPPIKDRAGNAL